MDQDRIEQEELLPFMFDGDIEFEHIKPVFDKYPLKPNDSFYTWALSRKPKSKKKRSCKYLGDEYKIYIRALSIDPNPLKVLELPLSRLMIGDHAIYLNDGQLEHFDLLLFSKIFTIDQKIIDAAWLNGDDIYAVEKCDKCVGDFREHYRFVIKY